MRNEIFLCKPKGAIVKSLMIDEETVNLTETITSPWELSFSMHRYLDKKENPYYHSVSEMMELYLVSDFCTARFIIDQEPSISSDGVAEVKNVVAHSIEAELQYKNLENFQINTGKPESQENLVKGDITGKPVSIDNVTKETYDYNLNPYTNLPVDYITVACNLEAELQAFYNDFKATSFKWKFEGDDVVTTVNYSFNGIDMIGDTTEDEKKLKLWYEEFTNHFPRIISNIIWGYDARGSSSTTNGMIICVTDTFVATDDTTGHICVPNPSYKYIDRGDGSVNITNPDSSVPTGFNRLQKGLEKLIKYYKDFAPQLSLLDIVLEKAKGAGWTVGNVPEEVRVRKSISFEVDSQDIYSFLTNTIAHALKVIFDFDRVNKRVNVIDPALDDKSFETGIVTGFQNLLQSVDITTGTEDGIKTVFKPKGADDLGIEYVNFGKDKISNLDYFINKIDKGGDYQYGTAQLHDKYGRWKSFRDETQYSVSVRFYTLNINTKTIAIKSTSVKGTRRDVYIELSKRYNQTLKDINELTYLVPSDGAMTDYTTYPLKDLKVVYQAYLNAYDALVEIYKAEYGISPESDQNVINTYFYQDYILYHDTILPNVKNALRIYALTDGDGNFLDEDGNITTLFDEFVYPDGGNPQYNGNAKLVTENKSEAYLYDMSLYGLSELNIKKKAWAAAAAQIYNEAFIKNNGTPGVDATYRTWADVVAAGLDSNFADQTSYERILHNYMDYMATNNRDEKGNVRTNGLTKKQTKGVVVLASAEIAKCERVINTLTDIQNSINTLRQQLAASVTYEGWNENGGFTDEEKAILHSLEHEADYSNENILITNLDDIVSTVDVQEELYQDAQKRLYDKSRPQYSFKTSLDNILAIDGFASLRSQLKLLNYFYLKYGLYDDETLKLRIVQMEFNPIIPTADFTLEFSNMTYTYEGINDIYYLFEEMGGSVSSSGSSSSGGGSGGTYGENDAQITLSNNMLSALLKNDTTAHSLNIDNLLNTKQLDNLLVNGDLQINGKAITNIIQSQNYSTSPAAGSMLDLKKGSFSFAGGKLTYNDEDDVLSLKGTIEADSGKIGKWEIDSDGNLIVNADEVTILGHNRYLKLSPVGLKGIDETIASVSSVDQVGFDTQGFILEHKEKSMVDGSISGYQYVIDFQGIHKNVWKPGISEWFKEKTYVAFD